MHREQRGKISGIEEYLLHYRLIIWPSHIKIPNLSLKTITSFEDLKQPLKTKRSCKKF